MVDGADRTFRVIDREGHKIATVRARSPGDAKNLWETHYGEKALGLRFVDPNAIVDSRCGNSGWPGDAGLRRQRGVEP